MTVILREGFEDGQWTHDVRVFPVGGDPYDTQDGSIFTPKNWLFWYKHQADVWDIPEARHCWRSGDPNRIKSGDGAHMFFTFYRNHDAGYMRKITVTPGDTLRLTAWAHAWSNHNLEGHEDCTDDGRCSCGVGKQVIAIAAEDVPGLNGDPWNDAIGNSMFAIGIDPYGGEDPYSANVVWGDAFAIYNGYAKQLVVETEAVGTVATVFLRNVTLWPFKHNDAYWDDVKLESIEGPPPYESTMLVLPQGATPEQLEEIFSLAYPDRRTFGFSHDDAGNLNGTAVLYNIPNDEKDDYLDFYATHYPNVTVEFAYTSDWEEPPSGLLLWQCDSRWGDEVVAGPDCSKTLCQTGCWISDCAMAQRFYNIKADATPSTANKALGDNNGFSGCSTTWEGMKPALGLEVVKRTTDAVEVQEWLDTGNVCFAEVEPDTFLHFVLVTKYQESRFWMLDPYKNIEGWLDVHYAGVESWRLIRPYVAPSPPPAVGPLVSLHLQTKVEGVFEFVTRVKPNVIKIFQLEVAQEIKSLSPDTEVVLRYYTPNQNLDGDLEAAAKAYVRSFEDSLRTNAEWIDYVESWNETIATHDIDGIKRAVEFDCHFADALMALGLPVAPQLLNVAVGNPYHQGLRRWLKMARRPTLGPPPSVGFLGRFQRPALLAVSEIELMLPAVRQVIRYSGTLGYHAYGHAINGSNLNDNWKYFAGRALENWDPVFRAQGLYPKYIFGECGAFATCNDGWRASNCLNGDWPKYLAQLREFSDRVKAWNAAHGNRCLGGTLFTTGGFGWDSFEIRKAQMEDADWPV